MCVEQYNVRKFLMHIFTTLSNSKHSLHDYEILRSSERKIYIIATAKQHTKTRNTQITATNFYVIRFHNYNGNSPAVKLTYFRFEYFNLAFFFFLEIVQSNEIKYSELFHSIVILIVQQSRILNFIYLHS